MIWSDVVSTAVAVEAVNIVLKESLLASTILSPSKLYTIREESNQYRLFLVRQSE
jgi:hypothetical protein